MEVAWKVIELGADSCLSVGWHLWAAIKAAMGLAWNRGLAGFGEDKREWGESMSLYYVSYLV